VLTVALFVVTRRRRAAAAPRPRRQAW